MATGQARFSVEERLRLALCALLILLGLAVIAGWLLEVEALKSVMPGLATMKFNTAVGFVLAGTGFASAAYPRWRSVGVVAGVSLIAIGAMTLAEYVLDLDLGIDQLVFRDGGTLTGSGHPGRMSVLTAVAFSALGPAIMLLALGRSQADHRQSRAREHVGADRGPCGVGICIRRAGLWLDRRLHVDRRAHRGRSDHRLGGGTDDPVLRRLAAPLRRLARRPRSAGAAAAAGGRLAGSGGASHPARRRAFACTTRLTA